ncbi:MAG TPA: hypothetical protein VHM94_10765 [Acidimicrobiia bacterium]|jgi:hypothetical protein|nr:hypothetical protein [Acidimicrobiia bacterium]
MERRPATPPLSVVVNALTSMCADVELDDELAAALLDTTDDLV